MKTTHKNGKQQEIKTDYRKEVSASEKFWKVLNTWHETVTHHMA